MFDNIRNRLQKSGSSPAAAHSTFEGKNPLGSRFFYDHTYHKDTDQFYFLIHPQHQSLILCKKGQPLLHKKFKMIKEGDEVVLFETDAEGLIYIYDDDKRHHHVIKALDESKEGGSIGFKLNYGGQKTNLFKKTVISIKIGTMTELKEVLELMESGNFLYQSKVLFKNCRDLVGDDACRAKTLNNLRIKEMADETTSQLKIASGLLGAAMILTIVATYGVAPLVLYPMAAMTAVLGLRKK